jgi:hypothetical protein
VWLWISTAYKLNFERNTTQTQMGFIGTLAGKTTQSVVTTMQLEFPLFTLASQFSISYGVNSTNGQTCQDFYSQILLWPQTQTDALCSDPSNTFNFVPDSQMGYFRTSVALSTIYLYDDQFDTANQSFY